MVGASLATWLAQWAGIYCTLVAFGLERVGWGGAGLLLVTVTLAQAFPVLPGNLRPVPGRRRGPPDRVLRGPRRPRRSPSRSCCRPPRRSSAWPSGFLFLLVEGVGFSQLRQEAEQEERSRMNDPVDTLGGA